MKTFEMSSATIWLVSAICVDGLIIGANITEFTLMFKKWKKSLSIEILLCSLCISDILSGIGAFIEDSLQLNNEIQIHQIVETDICAYFFDCMFTFSVLVSNLHIISIAIKKLIAEVTPKINTKLDSKLCKIVNVIIVWAMALILSPVISIVPKFAFKDESASMEYVQKIYGGIFMTACILVFVIYMALFTILITQEKKTRERMLRELLPDEMKIKVRDRRNTYLCLLLGISFLVCVLPYSLGLTNTNFDHPFWNILIVLNHAFNPMVYFIRIYLDERAKLLHDNSLLITNEFQLATIEKTYHVMCDVCSI